MVERVAVGVERPRHHIHALHPNPIVEADGSLDGDGVGGGDLLAGEAGQIAGHHGIDAIERGDVVPAQQGGIGNAEAAAGAAIAARRLHYRPAKEGVGLAALDAGVHLRVVEAENPPEGSLQLKAHHLQLRGGGGAEAVEQNNAVGDGGGGVDAVQPEIDAVVLAACGQAGAWAEEGFDPLAVGVKDDAQRIAGGRGRHVGGRSNHAQLAGLLVGHGEVCAADDEIRAAHILIQRAIVSERDGGGGNGAPKRRRRIHHRDRLLVGHGAVQRTLIDVVVHLAIGPVNRLAEDSGVEAARPGHILWPAGDSRGGREAE